MSSLQSIHCGRMESHEPKMKAEVDVNEQTPLSWMKVEADVDKQILPSLMRGKPTEGWFRI